MSRVTTFWANATLFGDTLIAFSLLGLFARKRPDIVWALFLAALFATAWVHILKPLFDIPRPLAALGADMVNVIGVELRRNAFPSGHTTTAFTLAAVICLRGVHPALAVTALLLATLAGISRAVVGAHWPLDILAGAFGGWVAAALGVALGTKWAMPMGRLSQTLSGWFYWRVVCVMFWHDVQYPAVALQVGSCDCFDIKCWRISGLVVSTLKNFIFPGKLIKKFIFIILVIFSQKLPSVAALRCACQCRR